MLWLALIGLWMVISIPVALLLGRLLASGHRHERRLVHDPETTHGVKIGH